MTYACPFCSKEYKSEKLFKKHTCKQMERFDYCSKKNYLKHWDILKTIYKIKYKKNYFNNPYFDLINSKVYNQAIKFFDFCELYNIEDIRPYLEYANLMHIPLYMCNNNQTYSNFIKWRNVNEHPLLAKERTEKYLSDNNISLNTISQNRLYFGILSGNISSKYLKNIGFDVTKILDNKQLQDISKIF